jgi:hypothetical protein
MQNLISLSVLSGVMLALAGLVAWAAAELARTLAERKRERSGDRRQFARVPCHFRTLHGRRDEQLSGDLSLGGACVRMPRPAMGRRLEVLALNRDGRAAAARVEGRVVSVQREDDVFVHHLAFDEAGQNIKVAALVAAGTLD